MEISYKWPKKEMPFVEIFRYSGRRKVLFVLVKVLPI